LAPFIILYWRNENRKYKDVSEIGIKIQNLEKLTKNIFDYLIFAKDPNDTYQFRKNKDTAFTEKFKEFKETTDEIIKLLQNPQKNFLDQNFSLLEHIKTTLANLRLRLMGIFQKMNCSLH